MKQPIVLITNQVPEDHLAPLYQLAQVRMGPSGGPLMPREAVLEMAPELDAIINQHELDVDRKLLRAAPRLKVVANVAAGYNNFDLPAMEAAGVWGTNTAGVFAESAADHTLGLLLAVARRITEADSYCRSDRWASDGFQPGIWDGVLLSGKTLGVIGYGCIGQAVARRATAFGMNIIFHTAKETGDPRQRPLDELLSMSDIVSLHAPLTPETHHVINRRRLTRMPKGAILLNLARGPLVDEDALAWALASGHLLGAGMDVAENEPALHAGLLAHPRVVFTPHIGGGTVESRKRARLVCAENVAAVLQGKIPPNAVNKPIVDSSR